MSGPVLGTGVKARHGFDLFMQSYEFVGASYSPMKLEELKPHDGVIQLGWGRDRRLRFISHLHSSLDDWIGDSHLPRP